MSLINTFIDCISILSFHNSFSDYTGCVDFNSGYFLQDAREWILFQSHSLQFLNHSTVAFVATVSHLWWHLFLWRKYFPELYTYSIFFKLAACTFTLLVHLHTGNLPSKFIEYLVNNIIFKFLVIADMAKQNESVISVYTSKIYIVVSDTSKRDFLTFLCSQVSATSHLLWKHVKKAAMKLSQHYFPWELLQKQPQVFKSNLRGTRTIDRISENITFNTWFGKRNWKFRKPRNNYIILVFYIPFLSISFYQLICIHFFYSLSCYPLLFMHTASLIPAPEV